MDSNSIPIETLYRRRVEQFSAAETRYAGRERMAMNLRMHQLNRIATLAMIRHEPFFSLSSTCPYSWCFCTISMS